MCAPVHYVHVVVRGAFEIGRIEVVCTSTLCECGGERRLVNVVVRGAFWKRDESRLDLRCD